MGMRLRTLLSRRATLVALSLGAVFSLAGPFLPLLDAPGFESSLFATAWLAGICGILGVASGRREVEDARRGSLRQGSAWSSTAGAFGAAAIPALLLLLLHLGWTAFLASRSACSPTSGLGWHLILPLPTLLLATASGLALGLLFEGRRGAALAYLSLLAGSLLASLAPLYGGPQVFFYDHFFGYYPGPLYDELVTIERPLLLFRLLTLGWAAFAFSLAALLSRWRRTGAAGTLLPAVAVLALSLLTGVAGHRARFDLGFEQRADLLASRLGGSLEGEHCTLIHPREMPREESARLLAECDHRVVELSSFFGVEPERVTVFLHRSVEEKRRLVGAAQTQFAKPWLRQLHVDRRGFPHAVLKHELAHLVTAGIGRPPFRVSASLLGLFPLQGLIEGAAVAADWPGGPLSVHEQAAAMRRLGLAPDLEAILSATGFFRQSASRAYTYAGSFVRWLIEEEGHGPFAKVYGSGDFRGAYGRSLAELIGSWEAELDSRELEPNSLALAEVRFRRGSLFQTPCARELATLEKEARDASSAGDASRAASIFARLGRLDPRNPGHLLSEASAWALAGEAARVVELAAGGSNQPPAARARLWILAGDALAASGSPAEALAAYEEASALGLPPEEARSLFVRREAAVDPDLAKAVLPYLSKGSDGDLLEIRELLQSRPSWGTGWYLVGRRLHQRGRHQGAVRDLGRALDAELGEALRREARRIHALSAMALGREEACEDLESLAAEGSEGERIEASDLAGLCRSLQLRGSP